MNKKLHLRPYLIIDDGHGINTPGKRSPLFDQAIVIAGKTYYKGDFIKENQINEPIAEEVMRLARLHNISAVMLCPEQEDPPLGERIRREHTFHNTALGAAYLPILISIHCNAHDPSQRGFLKWTSANGYETFFCAVKPKENQEFATIVHKHCLKASGGRDRGIKTKPSMMIVRESKSIAALIECGFMTNIHELRRMLDPNYQHIMAQSIINAVMEFTNYEAWGK